MMYEAVAAGGKAALIMCVSLVFSGPTTLALAMR
jgi:hypothetical protein